MFLREIAEYDHKKCGEYFGRGRENMEYFYKKFQEYVIQKNAERYGYPIAYQLYSSPQRRLRKCDVFSQKEPCAEGDGKNNQECRYVSADGNKTQVHQLLLKDEVIAYKIQENIERCICTATYAIAESFVWNEVCKRLIHPVNDVVSLNLKFVECRVWIQLLRIIF